MKKVKIDLGSRAMDQQFLKFVVAKAEPQKQQTLLLAYIIEKIAKSSDLANQVVALLGDAEIDYKVFNRLEVFKEIHDFCTVEVRD